MDCQWFRMLVSKLSCRYPLRAGGNTFRCLLCRRERAAQGVPVFQAGAPSGGQSIPSSRWEAPIHLVRTDVAHPGTIRSSPRPLADPLWVPPTWDGWLEDLRCESLTGFACLPTPGSKWWERGCLFALAACAAPDSSLSPDNYERQTNIVVKKSLLVGPPLSGRPPPHAARFRVVRLPGYTARRESHIHTGQAATFNPARGRTG